MEKERKVVGEIELPEIDVTPYEGMKAPIAEVTLKEAKFGMSYLVKTEPVHDEGNIKICGSQMFGLFEDENGNLGWGKDTKLGLFLKKYKVTTPEELIGVEVLLVTKVNNGKTYLSIV